MSETHKIFVIISALTLELLVFAGCQSTTKTVKDEDYGYNESKFSRELIREAEKYLGIPYCYGGSTSKCLDCSGFINLVFGQFGIALPRTASDIYDFADKINVSEAKAGDLVFFKSKNKVNHVGIYINRGEFIHSSSSKGVTKSSLSENYYSTHFLGAGRVISIQP